MKTITLLLLTLFCVSIISVSFVVNVEASTLPSALYEYYDTNWDAAAAVYSNQWKGQTFTPERNHYLTTISLYLRREGSCGNATLGIRQTSGGEPTGGDIENVTILESDISTTSIHWQNFTISSILLNASTMYAIVLRTNSGSSPANWIEWEVDSSSPTYSGGTYVASSDSGSSWNIGIPWDAMFRCYGEGYSINFYGKYNEEDGLWCDPSSRATNVSAYFTDGSDSEIFEVNGTYSYATNNTLQHFSFLGRQYWIGANEPTADIYIFNASTTTYTISFLDLAGALDDYPFVEAQRYVNGTLHTVEKRKVDEEKKIVMSLVNGQKYNMVIKDGYSYTYGDVLMTSITIIQLTLKGIDFPKETLLTYKYVRIYATRAFDKPNGNITITYQDTLEMTTSVDIYINYKNGTNAYNATETSDSFVHTWTSAVNSTDYAVVCTITHERYGVYQWKQYLPGALSTTAPWGLDFLGSSLPFTTSIIIPSLLIIFVAGCFSVINAETGAFMAVVAALVLAYLGWIAIGPSALVVAFVLAVLMGLVYAKRRVET